MCVWQIEERRCAAVLYEVFSWLDAASLARAGAACRAWRRAAAAPALWRRLLRRAAPAHLTPNSLRALQHAPSPLCWRQEYVSAHAGWRLRARHRAAAALLHAQLTPDGTRLALAAADAGLAVWQRCDGDGAGAWSECGCADMRARGWSAIARVHWAASGARLLLAGPLALVDDWELLVLNVEEDGRCGAVVSRVRCSAGAAGCWADPAGDAFVSLELRRLGPGLYCTTIWLNAATQETQSEYAGVRTPLLRIYNEDGEHITHVLVAGTLRGGDEGQEPTDDDCEGPGPGAAYLRAIDPDEPPSPQATAVAARVLVAASGRRLAAWPVRAPRPPPLVARAAGELAERVQRHREQLAQRDDIAPEPDEATVRAGCTPPARSCSLAASLVGLVLHERGRCMWAVCGDGSASCVSVATLRMLCRVRAPGAEGGALTGAGAGAGAHYVQPAVSATYLAWPAGAYSARVWCCAVASCTCGDAALQHGAAAVCCVLPPSHPASPASPPSLLVLAGDELYEWQSRATSQYGSGAGPRGDQ